MGTVCTMMPLWVVDRGGAKYNFSGTVTYPGDGSGVTNVTITLSGDDADSTTTAADGTWTLDAADDKGFAPGDYVITPTRGGHTFNPTSSAETVAGSDVVSDSTGLGWLLLDYFTTADAAPIASPRTPEPIGAGTTFVQTDGTQAIAGEELVFTAQATPVWGDQGFVGSGIATDAGIALSTKLNASTWEEFGIGWWTIATVTDPGNLMHAFQLNTTDGRLDNVNDTPVMTGLSTGTEYALSLIWRGKGCHHIVDGKLVWVS
jgi:hypothetical protein